MATSRADLAVLGAGPAGAACALAAAQRGLAVIVFDPRRAPTDAPCGEGIMPSGVDVLRALGLGAATDEGRPFDGVRHVVAGAAPLAIDLPRPGLAVRRPHLLAHLDRALADAGVTRTHATAQAVRTDAGFRVTSAEGDVKVRAVVGADGTAGAGLPGLAYPDRSRPPSRFGLRARFTERRPLDRVEVHFGHGCEVYLTPLPGAVVNVAVLFERPPADARGPEGLLAAALARHPAAAERLGDVVTPPEGRPILRRVPRPVAAHGAFLAGDAAGAVDPIVGCGVSIALRTGVCAARAATAFVRGARADLVDRRYAAAVRAESAARQVLATALRRADRHPRLARFTVGALTRMPAVARALARVAGGR
ncbi:MAG: lycopene cyclase family protein [Planctomycetota bacterium]